MILPSAHAAAMSHSGGNIRLAAAHLAERLDFDDELRREVATWLVALLFEPGLGEHRRIFKLDTGSELEAWVERHCPSEGA